MVRDLPCGQEKGVHYNEPAKAAPIYTERLKAGTWFGFTEVDVEIPKRLRLKFKELRPFFFTKQIPEKATPQDIKDYEALTYERLRTPHRQNKRRRIKAGLDWVFRLYR